MKNHPFHRHLFTSLLILLSIVTVGARPSALASTQSPNVEGAWAGTLDFGAQTLRIVLKIAKGSDGKLTATLDSLDQGATDLPVSSISLEGSTLRFEMKDLSVSFEGTVNKDATEVSGKFTQGATIPLILKRTDKKAATATSPPTPAPPRPQEPAKPYPYDEEEVSYENKAGGVKLAGTLTTPRTKGPYPAVILITGSGPQDRNEALLGHKPFLVLSDHFTRKGIAVLRVDDRGVGGSTGRVSESTSQDFAGDVLAGIEFLKTRAAINRKQIGLIGHSEGGLIAPIVASRSSDVAFIVLMAGPGLTGEEILYLQAALIQKANGASDKAVAINRQVQQAIFAVLKVEKDSAVAEKRIRESVSTIMAQMTEGERKAAGGDAAIEAQMKPMLSPWFRYFITYDPKPVLSKVKCPVLAINGEKDLQVPPDENLKAIEAALAAGNNKDFKAAKLAGLNHLFQTCTTGSPSEYQKISETMSPAALELMSDWILKRTTRRQ
jgi:pimeloyl-ACP methyl ester carboxylesterase